MTEPQRVEELVETIARRVVEILREESTSTKAYLTASEIASRYRVRPSWVYAHKRLLGAVPLGDGPKPRLRFDAATVLRELGPALADRPGDLAPPRRRRSRRRLVSQPAPTPLAQ